MPKVDINGTSLEVIEQGSGETIVFVHGSNGDYRTWQAQIDEFSQDFHAVAYSRRYHWPNEKIAAGADYGMPEQLDDLETFIRSLDAGPVHLVGHSYGAFISLMLAMREPQLIRSLVLAEPPVITLLISIPPKPQQILKLLLTRPRTALTVIRFAATGLNPATAAIRQGEMEQGLQIFGTAVLGPDAFNQLSPARMQQVRDNLIAAEFLGSGFSTLNTEAVSRVQTPVLLLNGENSPALFHRLNDTLGELLPNAERVTIPSASHIMHEDNTPAYNTAVRAFIERHSNAG